MKITPKHVMSLIDLVTRMRRCQRQFVSTNSNAHLREARDLEGRVDALLNEMRASGMPNLFEAIEQAGVNS